MKWYLIVLIGLGLVVLVGGMIMIYKPETFRNIPLLSSFLPTVIKQDFSSGQYYFIGAGGSGSGVTDYLESTTGNAQATWTSTADGDYVTYSKQYSKETIITTDTVNTQLWCDQTASAGGDQIKLTFQVYDCGTDSTCETSPVSICSGTTGAIDCENGIGTPAIETDSCTPSANTTIEANNYVGVRFVASTNKAPEPRIYYNSSTYKSNVTFTEFVADAVSDTTQPKWYQNSTNSTKAGTLINHSVLWSDDVALDGYIFSFDNGTGSFTNDSWQEFPTSNNSFSNVLKNVNQTAGSTIRWIVYANDTSNNMNITDTFQYTTTLSNVYLDLIYPTTSINVTQNKFFNVTLNVTCKFQDCGTINVTLDPFSGSGSGTSGDPYQITNWGQLQEMNDFLSSGAYFKLMNDLNKSTTDYETYASPSANSGDGWIPIGYYDGGTDSATFRGYFDGQNYTISDLYIYNLSRADAGIFGRVTNSSFKNFKVRNVSVTASARVGGVFGWIQASSNVSQVSVIGTVNGSSNYIGGLTGGIRRENGLTVNPSLNNSYAMVNIAQNGEFRGGMIGAYYFSDVFYDYSNGSVPSTGASFTGGLIAYNYGGTTIINSTYDSTTSGQSDTGKGIPLTTTQMQTLSTFTNYKWNIVAMGSWTNEVWYMDDGNDYPRHGYELQVGESTTKSGIIPTGSGTPFYTNASQNPNTTISLNAGESQLMNFWVNATGSPSVNHLFFAYVNLTSDTSISNITSDVVINISAPSADTCTYTSGNWDILASDNCVLSSPVDLGGNNVTVDASSGSGSLTGLAYIENAKIITGYAGGNTLIIT